MFTDRAKVFIKSGDGGNGHVSFRRELYVPNGGPDGGDGGRGGDIIFQVDKGLNTLVDFRHVRKYVAGNGEEGKKKRCHGADGKDLIIKVPEGTVVKDFESGKVITDMSGENQREVILKGGKGGLGNMHFATATMQVPKYAQPGQPGQELWVQLELKVLADVGAGRISQRGKVHAAIQGIQRPAQNRQLSFHHLESPFGCCESGGWKQLCNGGYPRPDRGRFGRRRIGT